MTPKPQTHVQLTRSQERLLEIEVEAMKGRDRNRPCPCGSGRKVKRCHGR